MLVNAAVHPPKQCLRRILAPNHFGEARRAFCIERHRSCRSPLGVVHQDVILADVPPSEGPQFPEPQPRVQRTPGTKRQSHRRTRPGAHCIQRLRGTA